MTEQLPPPPPPPPGYGAPGYPPPGYGQGQWPYVQQRGTNVLAIVALVSIFIVPVVPLVLGIIARNQVKQTGEEGDGMALAAIIVGAIELAFFGIVVLGFFGLFGVFALAG